MPALSNVKIVSDGTGSGTHIMVDGVELHGVVAVEWRVDASEGPCLATCTLTVHGAHVEFAAPSANLKE